METNDLLNAILSEMKSMRNSNRRWMSIEDLSDYLGLKINTIYQYVSQKKIPCKRIPGSSRLIFSRNEIDLWIEKGNETHHGDDESSNTANMIWTDVEKKHG
jgi:excisionase family DNA binding protein